MRKRKCAFESYWPLDLLRTLLTRAENACMPSKCLIREGNIMTWMQLFSVWSFLMHKKRWSDQIFSEQAMCETSNKRKTEAWRRVIIVKVSKYRKQNTKFSRPPKNQRNFVHFFALAFKKWSKQKTKALDDLN